MKLRRILGGIVWLLTVALGTMLPARVAAYERDGVSLGPRAAFFDPKDSDDGTWFGGAQMRIFFSPALALEGSVDYRKDEYADGMVEVLTWPIQASLLFYLTEDNTGVQPFLLGGAGWYMSTVEIEAPGIDESDSDDRFGLHAGGGLQFPLGENLSLDGTYRYVWLEALKSKDTASLGDKEYNDSGHMLTAALNFHF